MNGFRIIRIAAMLIAVFQASALAEPRHHGSDFPVRHLSVEEFKGLLSGAGMGMAMAAEINGYPGPKHAIELERELALTEQQFDQLGKLKRETIAAAATLGQQLVKQEEWLQHAFESKRINAENLREAVVRVSSIHAQLRLVHLMAHLEAAKIMDADQIVVYQQLRSK